MTDAQTQTASDTQTSPDSPVAELLAAKAMDIDSTVTDGAQLNDVAGPFLTADLVNDSGDVVGCIAVFDDPDVLPEDFIGEVAQAAASAAQATVREGEPVLGAGEVLARFAAPTTVTAFTDGSSVRAFHLAIVERRSEGGDDDATAAPSGRFGCRRWPQPDGCAARWPNGQAGQCRSRRFG